MKKLLYPLLLVILIASTGCGLFKSGGNELPVAYIDSISPSSATVGETVLFAGHGTDLDGDVVGYHWRSSIDGDIGSQARLNFLRMTDSDGQRDDTGWTNADVKLDVTYR
jgi:hypothetical protein